MVRVSSKPVPNDLPGGLTSRVVVPLTTPRHFVPPSARELRSQAVQRLQAGLFGLAAILLLVGLANAINDRARLAAADQARLAPPSANGTAPPGVLAPRKADPLADAGVVPSSAASAKPAPAPHPR